MEKDDKNIEKSKREALSERIKNKYPDKDFSDEEALYGQISDDYDEYDRQLDEYKQNEKVFSDMYTSDPRSATFLASWKNGEDPAIEFIRRFGMDIKDAIDDPEMQEQIAAANKEYVDRVAKSKELEEEYEKNISETLSYLETLVQEGKMQESEVDDVMELLVGIVHDGIVGKFSPETIEMAAKAISHDAHVEEAERIGEVRGRNAKIDEKLRKKNKGDGTAQLDGKNSVSGQPRDMSYLGALGNYGDGNQTIWERGGEKRIKARN